MGKPVPCNNCNDERTTISHVQDCVAVPIHEHLEAERRLNALQGILKMQMICLDLNCGRMMNRLARIGQDLLLLGRIGRLRQQALQAQVELYDPP
jgi:hypothetical protein